MVNSLQLLCSSAVSCADNTLSDGRLFAGSRLVRVSDPGNEVLGAAAERALGKLSESDMQPFALLEERVTLLESVFIWDLVFP